MKSLVISLNNSPDQEKLIARFFDAKGDFVSQDGLSAFEFAKKYLEMPESQGSIKHSGIKNVEVSRVSDGSVHSIALSCYVWDGQGALASNQFMNLVEIYRSDGSYAREDFVEPLTSPKGVTPVLAYAGGVAETAVEGLPADQDPQIILARADGADVF